jgi:gas vesicle protein
MATKQKNLQGECQSCRERIEFSAGNAGLTADCPHCGQPTELLPALPPELKSPAPTKAIIYTAIALVILLGGLIGTVAALKRAEHLSTRQRETLAKTKAQAATKLADPFAPAGFSVSPLALEKSQSGSIVHAVGKVHNLTNRQRFGVRIELELLDDTGSKVGEAKDYQSILEPNAEWQFHALVVEKRAVGAKVLVIKEAL